ncbi:MAG: hypothetical protein ACI8ZZ_002251, partial [Gammaproteobacteria bacterium]
TLYIDYDITQGKKCKKYIVTYGSLYSSELAHSNINKIDAYSQATDVFYSSYTQYLLTISSVGRVKYNFFSTSINV